MLVLLSDYLGTLLNVLSALLFAKLVLNEKRHISKFKLISLILLIALGLQLFCYLNLMTIKSFVSFLIFLGMFYKIYLIDMGKAIVLDFFYFVIVILSEMIFIKTLSLIIGEKMLYDTIAGGIFGSIIVYILMVIGTLLLRKVIRLSMSIKIQYKLFLTLIISILCIISIFYSTFQLGTNSADKILCFFSIGVIVLVLCYSFIQTYNNSLLTSEYDNLLSFIKKYEVEIENQRINRHETKNQFLTIKSKIIDNEEPELIINYIDEIINDDRKVKHSEYAKLKYLPSNGIKGLFYFKLSLAQEKGINVRVNISKSIENSFLCKLDSYAFNQIGKILGVFLDNAIESSYKSTEKIIGIEGFINEDKVIFIISNSYNKSIKINGRSSKGPDRGYGLLLVNNIITSNKKLNVSTEINNNLYIKKLTIKK